MEDTMFVGLDVHKRMTTVAIAERAVAVSPPNGRVPEHPGAGASPGERLKGGHRRLSFARRRPVRVRGVSAAQRHRP